MSISTNIKLKGRSLSVYYDYYPEIFTPCDEPDEPESIEISALSELTMSTVWREGLGRLKTNIALIDQNDLSPYDMSIITHECLRDYHSRLF